MSKYRQFIFKDYTFDANTKMLRLQYGYDDALSFEETYKFDFEFSDYDEKILDRAVQLLFFLAGVSYYKMYLAPEIVVRKGEIDHNLSDFLGETYQKGLGEFFYINNLSPATQVVFPVNSEPISPLPAGQTDGILVGLGGGKDSLVSVELMRDKVPVTTWSLGHRKQLEPLVETVGLPHIWVERTWDSQIKSLNDLDALNGHVPISAIFAAAGLVAAVLNGKRDVVVSNESSASEPTLTYENVAINHQYSKSLAFETAFQSVLNAHFGDSYRYYSLLRPFSELRISELFAHTAFKKYKHTFSSCNRAFRSDQRVMSWCGECAKCAFVFLILTPFADRLDLEELWAGKNLLLDPSLESLYRQLLGIEGDKPFDCVGEVKESRAAMRLAQELYPELSKYKFDLPESYDFRAESQHSLPQEIAKLIADATPSSR